MARVMDLHGWPPQIGGAHTLGDSLPITEGEATIKTVERILGGHVMFMCRLQGRSVRYHFFVPDQKTAEKIALILHENIGQSLLTVGTIELTPYFE